MSSNLININDNINNFTQRYYFTDKESRGQTMARSARDFQLQYNRPPSHIVLCPSTWDLMIAGLSAQLADQITAARRDGQELIIRGMKVQFDVVVPTDEIILAAAKQIVRPGATIGQVASPLADALRQPGGVAAAAIRNPANSAVGAISAEQANRANAERTEDKPSVTKMPKDIAVKKRYYVNHQIINETIKTLKRQRKVQKASVMKPAITMLIKQLKEEQKLRASLPLEHAAHKILPGDLDGVRAAIIQHDQRYRAAVVIEQRSEAGRERAEFNAEQRRAAIQKRKVMKDISEESTAQIAKAFGVPEELLKPNPPAGQVSYSPTTGEMHIAQADGTWAKVSGSVAVTESDKTGLIIHHTTHHVTKADRTIWGMPSTGPNRTS